MVRFITVNVSGLENNVSTQNQQS